MAAINLLTPGVASVEEFDSLASTGTSAVLPNGWAIAESGTAANATYTAGNGSGNTGDTYSFGATGSTERALGTLQSGALIPMFGANFTNGTGGAITSLSISYAGEEWRLGTTGRADRLDFQYSLDATSLTTGTWTDVDALDFNSPDIGTIGTKDGDSKSEQTAISSTIAGLSIGAGVGFWIRWVDFNATGSDDGLAVDHFSITPGGAGGTTTTVSINNVTVTEGTGGATNATFTVTRSDASGAFSLAYATADGTATAGSDYTAASGRLTFTAGGALTQTITIAISPDAITEPNETFSVVLSNLISTSGVANISQPTGAGVILNDDVTVVPIYTIQGLGHASSFAGQVVTTTGVVTALTSNGFYLQDARGDGDVRTSDGILVFTSTAPTVAVGASVQVSGMVSEFFPVTSSATELSVTQISAPTITVLGTAALPDAVLIGAADPSKPAIRTPPTVSLGDNVTTGVYDPATQGSDFYESLEGMRVTLLDTRVTGPYTTGGTLEVTPNLPNNPSANARGGLTVSDTTPGQADPAQKVFDFNPERLQLFGGAGVTLPASAVVGDRLGNITGVLTSFSQYELLPTSALTLTSGGLQKETSTIAASLDRITVASFNVQNLSPVGTPNGDIASTPQSKFDGLAAAVITSLGTPTIIALEEVQDNNGTGGGGGVGAHLTLQTLIDAIVAKGGPRYTAIDAPPVDGQEGGAPGGNIRNAYLYLADKVTPTAANKLVLAADGIYDYPTAQRIGTGDANFSATRKSVPIEWSPAGYSADVGGTFYTVANHFTSKGGSDSLYSTSLGQAPYNENLDTGATKREAQAAALNAFVDGVLADGNPSNDKVIALGDFNEFQFFPALQVATGALERVTAGAGAAPSTFRTGTAVLTDLITTLPAAERYTYNFDGNAQALDHILVTNGQVSTTLYDVVHLNSEFPDQLSDHDPSIVSLLLPRSALLATSGADRLDQAAYTAAFGAVRGSLAGADTIDGGAGADFIDAAAGNDLLLGGAGDDVLDGGAGSDTLDGGDGTDTALYISAAAAVTVSLAVQGAAQNTVGAGADTLIGIENVTGSSFDDALTGSAGANLIAGGLGADVIAGGAGADTFRYAVGDSTATTRDTIRDFETGLDRLDLTGTDPVATALVRTADGTLVFSQGRTGPQTVILVNGAIQGADVQLSSVAGAVGLDIVGEDGVAEVLIGGAGPDKLFGLSGSDILIGGAGDDQLFGDAGADVLTGGDGADRFAYRGVGDSNAVGGYDIVTDFVSGTDKVDLTYLAGLQSVALVRSGSGAFLFAATAAGQIQVGFTNGVQAADLINPAGTAAAFGYDLVGSAAGETLTGTGGNDRLYGLAGNDVLVGGAGDDILYGDAGGDVLTGGAGADVFAYRSLADSPLSGFDVITDFVSGADKIDLRMVHTSAADKYGLATQNGSTLLFFDQGGDGVSELVLVLQGVVNVTLADILF